MCFPSRQVPGKAAVQNLVVLVSSILSKRLRASEGPARCKGRVDRPKDNLVISFVDTLIYGLFEGGAELKGRRQTLVALRACWTYSPH